VVADALRLLVLLRSGRWRAADLAGEIGCNPRTVYRLLHALEAAGLRVERQVEGPERLYRVRREDVRRLLRV
jgi:DNA-binding IclR family transcriptional regulator